jgi:hypothetical protein
LQHNAYPENFDASAKALNGLDYKIYPVLVGCEFPITKIPNVPKASALHDLIPPKPSGRFCPVNQNWGRDLHPCPKLAEKDLAYSSMV